MPVDWPSYFAAIGVVGNRVDLPTYAFDRQRFWVPTASAHAHVSDAGLARIDHPFLTAATELAVGDQWVLSGRVSRADHSWLADHAIFGTVVFPGAALVELAQHAAKATGCHSVEELNLQAPLLLGDDSAQLQIIVGPVENEIRREIGIYSRNASDSSWVRHAAGSLSTAKISEPTLQVLPPEDATPIDTADLYLRLAGRGYGYGPAFQGVRRLWRRDDEVFGEIELPEPVPAGAFAIHPALFDAALQPMLSLFEVSSSEALLPYSWSGVSFHSTGGSANRTVNVRIVRTGATEVSLSIVDSEGSAVLSVEALTMLPASAEQIVGVATQNSLLAVEWVPLPLASDAAAPLEVIDVAGRPGGDVPTVVKQVLHEVLGRIQERLRDERPERPRFVVVTTRAVAVGAGESPDLSIAAVWGLVRSVQAEHPDQFILVDVDDHPESRRAIEAAASLGESQVALRRGVAFVPRLAQLPAVSTSPPRWNPNGTVLVTGATGGLGTLFARHLVADCGVRHLLLLSRSGPASADQITELTALGAEVAQAACDVSDAAALAEQVARIPAEAPLTAVVHLAGILDDGAADSLTPERIDAVLRPKVDAAWFLHELTKELHLDAFVLFSSVASTIGTPGQANYAAANAFLDALAVHRKSSGMPATALAWGPWELGMAAGLGEIDIARFRRSGIVPIAAKAGTAMFDAALAHDAPVLTPLGVLPALFKTMTATQPEEGPEEPPMVQRLRELAPNAQREEMVDLLLTTAAIVLDYPSTDDIDPDQSFKEIGFDSLSGVEFRNQVRKDTGVQIPPTVVFNYPTPAALADHLLRLLFAADADQDEASDSEISDDASGDLSHDVDDEIDALDVENLISRAFAE
ncbi:type I polyketide synthase [Antrihabitans stalagmiti]|uniref:type I polyketide synthase n=1 Tax=Antrihabitans stalagmiti TaxID=2799499 RepID=UPI003FD71CAA